MCMHVHQRAVYVHAHIRTQNIARLAQLTSGTQNTDLPVFHLGHWIYLALALRLSHGALRRVGVNGSSEKVFSQKQKCLSSVFCHVPPNEGVVKVESALFVLVTSRSLHNPTADRTAILGQRVRSLKERVGGRWLSDSPSHSLSQPVLKHRCVGTVPRGSVWVIRIPCKTGASGAGFPYSACGPRRRTQDEQRCGGSPRENTQTIARRAASGAVGRPEVSLLCPVCFILNFFYFCSRPTLRCSTLKKIAAPDLLWQFHVIVACI